MSSIRKVFPVQDYDLAATLASGQAFRWRMIDGAWEGIVASHWIRVMQDGNGIVAECAVPISDWNWLADYLQIDIDLEKILQSFPKDEPLQKSVNACRGLRLLRQDPWECLASFILSSTKQIVQIQQIVALLCERFGDPIPASEKYKGAFTFPTAAQIAACSEADLRNCKMGFCAPYLLGSARMIVNGELDLQNLYKLSVEEARDELLELPGVGRKIADCVLLFAYGFQQAFPIDVWVLKALRELYFPKRRPDMKRLIKFSETYFGPYAGYAQQYLFHYMRTRKAPLDSQSNFRKETSP